MQRSKQQALMFLLGAVLVGGVLGFSADRVFHDKPSNMTRRERFYDYLGLSQAQRTRMDSLLDDQNCQMGALMKPIKPRLDSIKESAHQQMVQILSPEQQARLELRRKEEARRDSLRKSGRDSSAAKTTSTCKV